MNCRRVVKLIQSSVVQTSRLNPTVRYLSSRQSANPYSILGVSKNATEKEIKIAYFREAKKWHPDLNPNDATAKAKFQQVAAAYELLSDPAKRRIYDATGQYSNEPGNSGTQWNDSRSGFGMNPEETFRGVREDAEVIKDALRGYVKDVQSEFTHAADSAMKGEWKEVWEVAKSHKVLILGFVVPSVLIFRYPAAVFAIGRVLLAASELIISALLVQGKLNVAASYVWNRIVALSRDQIRRRK